MKYDNVPAATHKAVLSSRLENLEVKHLQLEHQRRDAALAGNKASADELARQLKAIEEEHDRAVAEIEAIDADQSEE